MAKAPQPQTQSAAPMFAIDDGKAVPPRTKDIPEYGLLDVFEKMKKGQSVLIPFAHVPVEHARTLVQRFARADRKNPVDMVTRTEKSADGETAIGLRVWRNS